MILTETDFSPTGQDVIGLAETGSGKTGAFALPILQTLLDNPQRLYALVLTPTRELAFQISEQFEALGASIGVKCGKSLSQGSMYIFYADVLVFYVLCSFLSLSLFSF